MKKRIRLVILLALAFMLPVATMLVIAQSGTGNNVAQSRPKGPGDIYTAAGNPCVAAHSTTRALYASYDGPLYQVMRQSDGKILDISVVQSSETEAGGYADASAQDAFCDNTVCWITTIYDQSGHDNHLVQAPPGTFKGPAKGGFNTLPLADMAPITIMGHKAYGVYIMPGMGLRCNNATGVAINDEPEGIYYVVDGKHYDSGCCFDYGNASTNSRAVGTGTMETTYFGTATAWGSGNGPGPWIMADMEAGLFSGYNAKQNDVPTIDSWRFVTAVVNGGGGNQWDLRGGNAQQGPLTTFYSGVRPGSPASDAYYPMHKQGAILLGNGGDNGNGSAGTFYEGVMTTGYPTEATTDAVQANIVAARYDVQRVSLSRVTTFTPQSTQDLTMTFTNTMDEPASNVKLRIALPTGWTALVSGSTTTSKTFLDPIAPGASVSATFKVTSPETTGASFLTGKAAWKNSVTGEVQFETAAQRVRNAFPVKINEVRFSAGTNSTNQFIELYNASAREVDLSRWTLIHTRSESAPIKAVTIPAGTKLQAHGFYLLGLSSSGLAAPASPGATTINVLSTSGLDAGQKIDIDGETRTIANIGTPATAMTTVFIPVSTGPWLNIPAGSTNLPVMNAAGFETGQKIGIDIGGNYEIAAVTAVGKAATQTTLSVAAKAGDTTIKVAANYNMTVGDTLTIGTGVRKELVKIKRIINTVAAPTRRGFGQDGPNRSNPGEVELTTPLKFAHMVDVDVSDVGTGISFSPAMRFVHKSGDAVQALGSGITLKSALDRGHEYGAAVVSPQVTMAGYQGSITPNQWYGAPLSTTAGSIALMDADGKVVVDAMVYGSQQSSSSANGTITSPEIATLEGDQSQGGCIVVAPASDRDFGFSGRSNSAVGAPNLSVGRFLDGLDTDSNCSDFLIQSSASLSIATAVGSKNIKVAGVEGFVAGQKIFIDAGANLETAVIATVGTAGGTTVGTASDVGTTMITVTDVTGFSAGQTITIDSGANKETAVVASVTRGRRAFGDFPGRDATIRVATPLTIAHAAGAQVSGSGITLTASLTRAHDSGAPVANAVPTPGTPNQYTRRPQ